VKVKCAKYQKHFSPISFLGVSYPSSFPPINIIPLTEVEIRGIIKSLKSQGSSGYVKISSKIMWNTNYKPLSYICNKSISIGICPKHLKYANVKPLHMKGMANCRPVFFLVTFSKIVGTTTVYHRLNHHL
jgi:hypothetical protein